MHTVDINTAVIPRPRVKPEGIGPDAVRRYLDRLGDPPPHLMQQHASLLGVEVADLLHFDTRYDGETATLVFPMRDGRGRLTGCRMRRRDGKKWSLRGGREGLVVGCPVLQDLPLIVTEGATDAAAARHAEFKNIVARSNCNCGMEHIKLMMRRFPATPILVFSDPNEVGIDGSKALAYAMPNPTLVFVGPSDVRQYVNTRRTDLFADIVGALRGEHRNWRIAYRNLHAASLRSVETLIARLK